MVRWVRSVLYRPLVRGVAATGLLAVYWVGSALAAVVAGDVFDPRPLLQHDYWGLELLGAVVMFAGCMHAAKFTRSRGLIWGFGLLEGWMQGAFYGEGVGRQLVYGEVTHRAQMGLVMVVAGCAVIARLGAAVVWATAEGSQRLPQRGSLTGLF